MPLVPLAEIRALGFEWPHSPLIEESAFMIAGKIDLNATFDTLNMQRDSVQSQVRAAQKMKADTSADHSDLSNNYDELASKLFDLEAACNYVKSIIAALPGNAPLAAGGGPPTFGGRSSKYAEIMRESPLWLIVIFIVVLGAIGGALIAVAIDEGMRLLLIPGTTFAGLALALVLGLIYRALHSTVRGSRKLAHDAVATPSRRRVLKRVGIVVGILLVFVFYNWFCWYGIHQDCTRAGDTDDLAESAELILQARSAMENPLLVLPTDLFDLHGPNRCESAQERFNLEP